MPEPEMRPGTLRVLEPAEGLIVSPTEGMVLWFGRNRPEVHICVGADDLGVSRRHGALEYDSGCWWVRPLGTRPVRVGLDQVLLRGDEPVPLPDGRTSLQLEGLNSYEVHVVRVEVVGPTGPPRTPVYEVGTATAGVSDDPLTDVERYTLTAVAQRLLRHDPEESLLTYDRAAEELEWLRCRKPGFLAISPTPWTDKKVERLATRARRRLAKQGLPHVERGPGETVYDSTYLRNLVNHLIRTGVLSAEDLRLLDLDDE